MIYPVRDNTELRVNLGFHAEEPVTYDHCDVEAQKRLVAERYLDARWEVPRPLRAVWDAPDFYFDSDALSRSVPRSSAATCRGCHRWSCCTTGGDDSC